MHPVVSVLLSMCSIIMPGKLWFGPGKPVPVEIQSPLAITLTLLSFDGKPLPASGPVDFGPSLKTASQADLEKLFPQMEQPGTYVLLAVPTGKPAAQFIGTPLVIEVLDDKREGQAGAMVRKIEPLEHAVITTANGPVDCIFYYDVAPHTVDSFLRLSEQGYYDGLMFHRIVPGFVIQGGDPKGTGTGGPGYSVQQEFNDRPHLPGALSMARSSDPDSAGSQFFVCLDYAHTKQLDHQYTVFGTAVRGMDAVNKIAATPLADAANGTPATPQVIEKVEAFPVTAENNPYANLFGMKK